MPILKFKHVSSVSSEDPNHPAINLLSQDTYRKWQSSAAGEKQAVIVLELEKSSQIHSIDIGNNGCAFIEVLVGKSTSDEFHVLLVASSFMSPADSKAWTNINKVRMFGKEKISKTISGQNWDLIKIVCTQPFNKNEKYGLSFITLHSPPDKTDTPTNTTKKLGIFALKDDTAILPMGSLFHKRVKDSGSTPSPTTPPTSSSGSLAVEARRASAQAIKEAETKQTKKETTIPVRTKHQSSSEAKGIPPSKKPKIEDDSIEFNELLKGVVFSLSGFKNPMRGDLRTKGIDMGATYEPDWGPNSTHLICAFEKTPKFNQVKSKKGIVVKKEWILNCHQIKKRLPASKFRFTTDGRDSDDEIDFYDSKEAQIFKNVSYTNRKLKTKNETDIHPSIQENKKEASPSKDKSPLKDKSLSEDKGPSEDKSPLEDKSLSEDKGPSEDKSPLEDKSPPEEKTLEIMEDTDPYGGSTDEDSDMDTEETGAIAGCHGDSEDCDTEDEIERVKQSKGKDTEGSSKGGGSSRERKEHDIDQSIGKEESLLDLPSFFADCHFLLYGNFTPSDLKLIKRYITAYNGHIEDYMSDKVTHVVSVEQWDDNFDQALSENSSLVFVKPAWIFKCHSNQSLVPSQSFAIAPL